MGEATREPGPHGARLGSGGLRFVISCCFSASVHVTDNKMLVVAVVVVVLDDGLICMGLTIDDSFF